MSEKTYKGKFGKVLPNIVGVEIDSENTYLKAIGHNGLSQGVNVPTPYVCRELGVGSIGEAFSCLSKVAEANKYNQKKLPY